MLNLGFVGGVIYGDLDVRRYLMTFLNNAQKSQIKICGNEDFVESLSSIPYSKGIQYLHVIHSENTQNVSKWIHTICGMLLRMIDCPQYTPLIVYGTDRWEGQLFSGAVISEQEVFFVSEDAKQGMILRDADQIKFVNHYFAKMSENGKKIAVPVKREKLYETADNNVMCIQNWIELDHISPKKGIRYITTDAVKSFVEKESLWHCFKNDWFQYTLKSGKKKILEEILDDSNSILIDSALMQLRKNLKVELCEDRFFYISVADTGGIWTYEVCVPELIQWFGYALKEMADSEFVMTEERKRQFLSQMMKNAELEDKKDV